MRSFELARFDPPLAQVLCLGAHADDIEIGCAGAILLLAQSATPPAFTWVVFSSDAVREEEALRSAQSLLRGTPAPRIRIEQFRDGFLPYDGARVKDVFEALKATTSPDLVLTHHRNDLHQDHRLIAELTWNTFRDHWILEYEVPKYDGDLGAPNVFVPLSEPLCARKIEAILRGFPSQNGKRWFTEDVFRGLSRLRGVECNASSGYAEAFFCRKLVIA
jgi:LmbE family N-acetylglucosaminyl deacetylase